MSKKTIVFACLGLIGLFGIATLVIIVGIIIKVAQPPYPIAVDKLTPMYLESRTTIGDYRLVQGFAENPIKVNDTESVAYYTVDGKPREDDNESYIGVGKGEDRIKQILESIEDSQCSPRSQTAGSWITTHYYRGSCGTSNYYVYIDGIDWIVFSTEDGSTRLEELVTNY